MRRIDLKPISEAEFMAQVIQYARLHGWLEYHTHDSRHSTPGFPDLVFVRGAVLLFAELKVAGRKLTAEQAKWVALLEAAGLPVYLWRETDWPEIEAVLGAEE